MEEETTAPPTTATESFHDARYVGENVSEEARSLRLFAERRLIDPDKHTIYEGTVDQLQGAVGGLWDAQIAALQAGSRAKHAPSSASRTIALSGQNARARSTLLWWDRLGKVRQATLETIRPGITAGMVALRKRVA